ncbi:DUF547 domain-containing protein [Aquimarina sp. W85]|uniref:DUF547 domain-containing protein n=1 Tax=Aquimarina rhodophyticola TaxID=3342246 RepID=UPI0036733EB3
MKVVFKRSMLLLLLLVSTGNYSLFSAPIEIIKQDHCNTIDAEILCENKINDASKIDHSSWDRILKIYVYPNGDVNYKGLKKNRVILQRYLEYLSRMNPNKNWSKQELLAFYINLYNAYTIDLIVENYPVSSIKDIRGAWTKDIVPLGNKMLSLSKIEHEILRKMNEPRIHFAINCASVSCPKLLNEAFTASKINKQLDKATREFINSDKNIITANSLQLSSIFDWYKKDYLINGNRSIIDFINPYTTVPISTTAKIRFLKYNWSLNE